MMVFWVMGESLFGFKPTLLSTEFLSVRQMGMGKAYTAVANDETLLQANPAGIGVRKMFQKDDVDSIFYFLPFKVGISSGLYQAFSGDLSGLFDVGKQRSDVSLDLDDLVFTDFVYAGNFWALSIFTRLYGDVYSTGDMISAYFDIKFISQINVGFNVHSFSILSEDDLHIGVSGKLSYQAQFNKNKTTTEIYNIYKQLLGDLTRITPEKVGDIIGSVLNNFMGVGIGLDIGAIWEISIQDEHQVNVGMMLEDFPTYGISVSSLFSDLYSRLSREVCKKTLANNPIANNEIINSLCDFGDELFPESTFFLPNFKVGVAYFLPNYLGSYFRDTLFAIDVHRIGTPDYTISDIFHFGISTSIFDFTDEETGYGYRMNLSMGVNQNQFNTGVLFHLKYFEMAYNYYREKLLKRDGHIRRHVLTFAWYF